MKFLEVTCDQPNTYVLTDNQHTELAGMTAYGNVSTAEIRTAAAAPGGSAAMSRPGLGAKVEVRR
jgi:hypothetical protein